MQLAVRRCKLPYILVEKPPPPLSSKWPQPSLDCGPNSSARWQLLTEVQNIRAELAQQALSKCPDTKVVLSGYSQGGQLVHNAAKLLPAKTAEKIAAAVTFGDPGTQTPLLSLSTSRPIGNQLRRLADHETPPDNGQAFANIPAGNGKIYCHPLDNICQNGVIITAFHYSYSTQYVPAAADFVSSKLQQK